jgi:hypothetical protein
VEEEVELGEASCIVLVDTLTTGCPTDPSCPDRVEYPFLCDTPEIMVSSKTDRRIRFFLISNPNRSVTPDEPSTSPVDLDVDEDEEDGLDMDRCCPEWKWNGYGRI